MPWRLSESPDDPSVRLELVLPKSMKAWLVERAGGDRNVSKYLRAMIRKSMVGASRRDAGDLAI